MHEDLKNSGFEGKHLTVFTRVVKISFERECFLKQFNFVI